MRPEEPPVQPAPATPQSVQRPPPTEVAWAQDGGSPIHPMLSIDQTRRAAFVCLPLPMREGERGGGGIRAVTKPYLVIIAPGLRQLIPLELTALPLEQEPVFADAEARWPLRQLETFLSGAETPPQVSQVFAEVNGIISKYLELADPSESKVVALYTLMSYVFPLFSGGLPFLKLQSAGPGSGKTKLCSIIAHLGFNAVLTSSVSAAAIFRVGSSRCLLLLDEAEDLKTSMATLLNASYRKGSSVLRAGSRGRLERFALWGPRVISSLQPLPDSVASRCILIRMSPARDAARGRLSVTDTSEDWAGVRARIYAAMLSRWEEIDTTLEPKVPTLTNRSGEIWTPLIQIATAIEPQCPGLVKEIEDYIARAGVPTLPTVPALALSEAERAVVRGLARLADQGRPAEVAPGAILAAAAGIPGAAGMTANGLGVILRRLRLFTSRRHTAGGQVYRVDWNRVTELSSGLG